MYPLFCVIIIWNKNKFRDGNYMPEISMELFCLAVMVLVAFLFFSQKHNQNRGSVHSMFARLMVVAIVLIVTELAASYFIVHMDIINRGILIGIMSMYMFSIVSFLYVSYIYIKRLINTDVPSLRKIGNWANYLVGGLFAVMLVVPFMTMENGSETVLFGSDIMWVFAIFAIQELFVICLLIYNRQYVNVKRRKIIVLASVLQSLCIFFQLYIQNLFLTGIGVTIVTISFYMTLEDEDVKLIDQLELEKENADKANNAKSGFIANVSHEIRTPINAILGMDEIILRESKEANIRRYASDIKSAAQTLHGIMNEILDISKIESGKMELEEAPYEIRTLINDTSNFIQLKVKDKGLDFKIEVDKELPSAYWGDGIRLKQILTNILTNAVKYTEEGEITLLVSDLGKESGMQKLHFEVRDTGIGMRQEDLDKITQEYQRFDTGRNRNVEGTGLGMSITMQFIKLFGSELKIESEYGVGSVFEFDIEQRICDENPVGDIRIAVAKAEETYSYSNMLEIPSSRVLVVDDNAINRKVFMNLLKNTGLEIDDADSGFACLDLVKKNEYKIIFMDHMMPDMDGIETFHALREMDDNLSKDAKVIMLTANAVSGAKEQYLAEGFDDFIPKPIIPADLEAMIKKYS